MRVSGAEHGLARLRILDGVEVERVEVRRAAPVVGVGLEHHALVQDRVLRVKDPGTGADRRGLLDALVVDLGRVDRQLAVAGHDEDVRVRPLHVEAHRVVVDRFNIVEAEQQAGLAPRLHARVVLRDIARHQRAAVYRRHVVELRVAQGEGERQPVRSDLPAQGEPVVRVEFHLVDVEVRPVVIADEHVADHRVGRLREAAAARDVVERRMGQRGRVGEDATADRRLVRILPAVGEGRAVRPGVPDVVVRRLVLDVVVRRRCVVARRPPLRRLGRDRRCGRRRLCRRRGGRGCLVFVSATANQRCSGQAGRADDAAADDAAPADARPDEPGPTLLLGALPCHGPPRLRRWLHNLQALIAIRRTLP